MRAAYAAGYADPRRLHHDGRRARLLLDNAREAIADALGVSPGEVSFVPSGTHAVHLGLLGLARGQGALRSAPGTDGGAHLVLGAVEHSAVRYAAEWAAQTWRAAPTVSVAPVDQRGRIDRVALDALLTQQPGSVLALQAANPEVGTLQPVDEVAQAYPETAVFCDLAAAVGQVRSSQLPRLWLAAAASAHKWGGPAGVGVLLVRKGARWRSPMPADDRIDPRSIGFENIPAALGAAAALQAVLREVDEAATRRHDLIDRLRQRLSATVPDIELVGDPVDRLPHVLTFSCLYVDGEALVLELDRRGFAVSSGSACAAQTHSPSHVLEAMGVLTHGNVRVSVSTDATAAQLDAFAEAVAESVAALRAEVGL